MAGVRKTSGAGATRGVVYDLAQRASVPTAERGQRVDSSGITTAARELAGALQAVEESDEVRSERVKALRDQIANGSYNPDAREIAKKMVERGF